MAIDVYSFINSYTAAEQEAIAFSWVESEPGKLGDPCFDFRLEVIDALLSEEIRGPDELVRDVFLAEAQLCKAVWGAGQRLTDLGTLLLTQTGAKYLDTFFEGKEQSFDTECCVVCYDVSVETLRQIVQELAQKEPGEGSRRKAYAVYFQDQLERAVSEARNDGSEAKDA